MSPVPVSARSRVYLVFAFFLSVWLPRVASSLRSLRPPPWCAPAADSQTRYRTSVGFFYYHAHGQTAAHRCRPACRVLGNAKSLASLAQTISFCGVITTAVLKFTRQIGCAEDGSFVSGRDLLPDRARSPQPRTGAAADVRRSSSPTRGFRVQLRLRTGLEAQHVTVHVVMPPAHPAPPSAASGAPA